MARKPKPPPPSVLIYTEYAEEIEQKRKRIHRYGYPAVRAAENNLPTGQAALWYADLLERNVPLSAILVGRQIARLCGDDIEVVLTDESLTDAVGRADRNGHTTKYMERGRRALVEMGWIEKETVGQKRGARTTYRLTVGGGSNFWISAHSLDDLDEYDPAA